MKKILLILTIMLVPNFAFSQDENCDKMINKLKPSCNFLGKGVNKMKEFSKNNQTIDQTLNNAKKKK